MLTRLPTDTLPSDHGQTPGLAPCKARVWRILTDHGEGGGAGDPEASTLFLFGPY